MEFSRASFGDPKSASINLTRRNEHGVGRSSDQILILPLGWRWVRRRRTWPPGLPTCLTDVLLRVALLLGATALFAMLVRTRRLSIMYRRLLTVRGWPSPSPHSYPASPPRLIDATLATFCGGLPHPASCSVGSSSSMGSEDASSTREENPRPAAPTACVLLFAQLLETDSRAWRRTCRGTQPAG